MRVLVTGISGFLGWNLAGRLLKESDIEVLGTHLRHPAPPGIESFEMDLEKPASIRRALFEARPDAVVHAAAMANPAECEADPERARRVNADAVATMVMAIPAGKTHFVHCSTDLVFDGLNPPYREGDMRTPRSVYATTKARGERAALAFKGKSAVARLALMFGAGPREDSSFLGWLDAGLRGEKGVTAFRDEFRTSLYAPDAAEGLLAMVRRGAEGIFHLGGPEPMSREAFARLYATTFGLDETRVHPTNQSGAPGGPYRPPNVSLDIAKARRELEFRPKTMREALEDLKKIRRGSI